MSPVIPLGPFDLSRRVGAGGMGEVWEGVHRGQGVPVAVKVITARHARDRRHREALENEVRAVARLDHPGIVLVFDHGEVGADAEQASGGRLVAGSPYLAMEFAVGSLQIGAIRGWPDVRRAMTELLDALAHAHARGVVHRDLKPGNVLMFADGSLKIADFGLARAIAVDDGGAGAQAGTPSYMAPEQVRGLWRDFGPWTDLYALGCIGWAVACGAPPFDGTIAQLRQMHLYVDPPVLRPRIAVPPGLEAWLLRLLAKEPERRFQCAADALAGFEALGEADPGLIDPEETADPDSRSQTVAWSSSASTEHAEPIPAPPVPGAPSGRPLAIRHRPPVPATWATGAPARRAMSLVGAGLGLYGLRAVPLVDREAERDALWTALRDVHASGHARAVVLEGGPGTGKTRLAEWIAQRAAETGAAAPVVVRHGPADSGDGLRRALARALGVAGATPEAAVALLEQQLRRAGIEDAWEWRALAAVLTPRSDAGSDSDVQFGSVAERHAVVWRALRRLGAGFDGDPARPVLLVLDDAAWGPESVAFATWLVRQTDAAALIVLTVRDDEGAPGGRAAIEAFGKLRGVERRPIGPLLSDARRALVEGLLGLEGELADQVVERTGGNPLFAVQLVGDWVQRGVLEVSATGFVLRSGAHADLPDDIHALWGARIDRVIGAGRPALELAALLGLEVDDAIWRDACARLAIDVPDDLVQRLLDRGLATAGPRGWALSHGMLRESLDRSAREARRWTAGHGAAADALIARNERPAGLSERVARHLVEAGREASAVEWLLAAADERRNTSDPHGALGLLDAHDAIVDRLGLADDDARRLRADILRVPVLVSLGRLDAARSLGERTAARAVGRPEIAVPAGRVAAVAAQKQGDLDAADALLVAAEAIAVDPVEVGRVKNGRGFVARQRGRLEAALALFEEALTAFAGRWDRERADALYGLAATLRALGRLDDTERAAQQAIALFEALGYRFGEAACHNLLGDVRRVRGDLAAAEDAYARAERLLTSVGSSDALIARLNRGLVQLAAGRPADAAATFRDGLVAAGRAGRRVIQAVSNALLVPCAAALGDRPAFDAHLDEAILLLAETGAADADVVDALLEASASARSHGWSDGAQRSADLAIAQANSLGDRSRLMRARALGDGGSRGGVS